MLELTEFQKKCEQQLINRLKTIGYRFSSKNVKELKETSFADKELYIEASIGEFRIWIYEDEAEIQGKNLDLHFERPDYDSEEDLMKSFIDKIVLLLEGKEDVST